jgi:hypothetical protein
MSISSPPIPSAVQLSAWLRCQDSLSEICRRAAENLDRIDINAALRGSAVRARILGLGKQPAHVEWIAGDELHALYIDLDAFIRDYLKEGVAAESIGALLENKAA